MITLRAFLPSAVGNPKDLSAGFCGGDLGCCPHQPNFSRQSTLRRLLVWVSLRTRRKTEVGTMLARSPVPTTSPANASPRSNFHGFHYAPAPSPRYSCPRAPAVAQSRRPSGSSASTIVDPPATQPRRHVVADAAPQNSSIEPVNSANSALLSTAPSTETKHDPSTSQETMAVPEEGPAVAGQPQAKINKEVPSGAKQRTGAPTVPISPSKRRISQEPGSERTSAPEPSQNPSKEAKRAKPDTAPPKVLPLRYELCPVEDLVVLIAHMLGELIETNDTFALRSGHLTRFHSRYAPYLHFVFHVPA